MQLHTQDLSSLDEMAAESSKVESDCEDDNARSEESLAVWARCGRAVFSKGATCAVLAEGPPEEQNKELRSNLRGSVVFGPTWKNDMAFFVRNWGMVGVLPGMAHPDHPYTPNHRRLVQVACFVFGMSLAIVFAPPASCDDARALEQGGADTAYMGFVDGIFVPLCDRGHGGASVIAVACLVLLARSVLALILTILGHCTVSMGASQDAVRGLRGSARLAAVALITGSFCTCIAVGAAYGPKRSALWLPVACIVEVLAWICSLSVAALAFVLQRIFQTHCKWAAVSCEFASQSQQQVQVMPSLPSMGVYDVTDVLSFDDEEACDVLEVRLQEDYDAGVTACKPQQAVYKPTGEAVTIVARRKDEQAEELYTIVMADGRRMHTTLAKLTLPVHAKVTEPPDTGQPRGHNNEPPPAHLLLSTQKEVEALGTMSVEELERQMERVQVELEIAMDLEGLQSAQLRLRAIEERLAKQGRGGALLPLVGAESPLPNKLEAGGVLGSPFIPTQPDSDGMHWQTNCLRTMPHSELVVHRSGPPTEILEVSDSEDELDTIEA